MTMNMTKRIAVMLLVGVCAFLLVQKEIVPRVMAQETKMVLVERPDSEKLKAAYAEYVRAYDKWTATKKEIAKSYVNYGGKPMKGWEDVSFSVDFRIIVPAERGYYAIGPQGPTGPVGPTGATSVSLEEK